MVVERQELWGCPVFSGLHGGMPNPAEVSRCMRRSQGRCSCPLEKGVQQEKGWSEAEDHLKKTWSAICE